MKPMLICSMSGQRAVVDPLREKQKPSESPTFQEYRPIPSGLALPPVIVGVSGR